MGNQFTIEKAKVEDHLVLTQITFKSKAFWGYSEEQLYIWKSELKITPKYIAANEAFKLIVDTKIIGYYSYFKINEAQIKLDNLFLFPQFIGKGFGKILLEDFLKRVKKLEIQSIILTADPNAENFYKKFEFKTYSLKKSCIEGRFLPEMKLEL